MHSVERTLLPCFTYAEMARTLRSMYDNMKEVDPVCFPHDLDFLEKTVPMAVQRLVESQVLQMMPTQPESPAEDVPGVHMVPKIVHQLSVMDQSPMVVASELHLGQSVASVVAMLTSVDEGTAMGSKQVAGLSNFHKEVMMRAANMCNALVNSTTKGGAPSSNVV